MRFLCVMALLSSVYSAMAVASCDNAREYDLAKEASNVAETRYQVLNTKGISGVGVANCGYYYLSDVLGESHPQVARPDVCGVSIYFANKAAERKFAKWAIKSLPGGKFPVSTRAGEKLVPYCGQIIGEIVPQPGLTVRN